MQSIEARLKQIIGEVCQEQQAEIEELEVMPDHVHLLVSVDPQFGIHHLMKLIKGHSSCLLRQQFLVLKRKLPTLWTNSSFVTTTGGASLSVIKAYIEQQKMSKKQQSKQLKTATEKQQPRKTYQFRLYPTSRQIKVLQDWLGLCCDVYNAALDERRSAYRIAGISLSYAHQCAELPACKEVRPELGAVPAQVLQDAVKRVDRAYDDFFRRVEEGQKPGFPRFKSRFRYASLTFKQYENSFEVLPGNKKNKGTLVLAKLGQIKMVMHRAIKGTPKTAIVKRTPTGKWYVSISVEMEREEVQSKRLPACTEAVGLDVGLKTFAYLSTGEEIPNPRFFRAEEAALARAQRKLSKAPKGSRERKKKRKVVAQIHERISNRRANFINQQVASLIKRFGLLAVEALVVRNMVKNPKVSSGMNR